MPYQKARFIVGTGRCGSTILSKMMNLHPDVAVLSEFMVSMDIVNRLGQREISGADFADLLDCGVKAGAGEYKRIVNHLRTPEIMYMGGPDNLPETAEGYKDGVFPEILLIPLSQLFDDPEPVFHELIAVAKRLPTQLLSEQYRFIFEWLCKKAGKTIWIERSGGSIFCVDPLLELFPEAQFLYLYRDPLDVALSMQQHNHFRVMTFEMLDLQTNDIIRWADLDESDLNNRRPMSERLASVMRHPVPLEPFLENVRDTSLAGSAAVDKLTEEQYRAVSFERIMATPKEALIDIAEFFGLTANVEWLDRAAALLNPAQLAKKTEDPALRALADEYCGEVMRRLRALDKHAV